MRNLSVIVCGDISVWFSGMSVDAPNVAAEASELNELKEILL